MACPTCDHTMQSLRQTVFWCPRCGTVKHGQSYFYVDVPKLVDNVNKFEKTLRDPDVIDDFNRLGLHESTNKVSLSSNQLKSKIMTECKKVLNNYAK